MAKVNAFDRSQYIFQLKLRSAVCDLAAASEQR